MMFETRAALRRPSPLRQKCLFTILHTYAHTDTHTIAHIHMHPWLLQLTNILLHSSQEHVLSCERVSVFHPASPLSVLTASGWEALPLWDKANTLRKRSYKHLACEKDAGEH